MTRINFTWNGRPLSGEVGDTLAEALSRNGEHILARTRKHHRPLGVSGSYTAGTLARVDGRPHVRLDVEPLVEGVRVEMQNAWPTPAFDVLSLARLVPSRWLWAGFEHGRLTPSAGWAYHLWDRTLSWLAGVGEAPAAGQGQMPPPAAVVDLDVLVVGGGPAGISSANAAAAQGKTVGLVTRGDGLARFAVAMGAEPVPVHPTVQIFTGIEVFGAYQDGQLLVGASPRHSGRAILFRPAQTILATGRRSIPPLVPGSHLPGVMDAQTAVISAHKAKLHPGKAVAVVGAGDQAAVAERLRGLGGNVIHTGAVADLHAVKGRNHVRAIVLSNGRTVACDAVVHAGPWQTDRGLLFQARAEGDLQLDDRPGMAPISLAGDAAKADQPLPVPPRITPDTLVCPCMDVSAGELLAHIDAGVDDPEVLKRLTSCGMGPCQGWPCWNSMIALLAARTDRDPALFRRPSARAPRRALTVAQAATLWDVVEVER
ncbi:MAG: 2Fe-2S iron-sulfur cluster-binding protein [Pseudorhodobacter sp.]|nr:2Fe-2S iron-sulfur cluster-binding protein [Pseudorhodobacter sp.]